MSASSKKKLRNAQQADKLTEKQLQEQKEAKKLNIFTAAIVVVIALMVVIAAYTAITTTVSRNGVMERKTIALTVGEHDISNAELNYFYIDAINSFYSNYGSYASLFGLDTTLPLNEQYANEETGETWADYFIASAKSTIQAVYALTDEANAQGFTLTEDYLTSIDSTMTNMDAYATLYGYSKTDDYVKAIYGNGASTEGLRAYFELTALADAYQTHYSESLTYEDADLRAAEAENPAQYDSFSYNSYYLATSKFLEGGTTDDEGNTTYSDEEKAASVTAAEEAAKALAEGEYEDIAAFDAAIAALSINAEVENAASTAYTDTLYSNVNSVIRDWISDESRTAGEITYIPNVSHTHADGETHSEDEDTSAYDTVNGYYVVIFNGSSDNTYPLVNVRHILVGFEGGTTDEYGNTTYSDDEKAAAKTAAEEILAEWEAGDATEDSFAALANEKSADSDGTDGGLYENVYPGQMVTNFNDWCFAEGRKAGDTGIVESSYGYHVMYYSGDSETNYRDYMIESALRESDTTEWYNALVEAMTVTDGDTKYINKDLVLSSN